MPIHFNLLRNRRRSAPRLKPGRRAAILMAGGRSASRRAAHGRDSQIWLSSILPMTFRRQPRLDHAGFAARLSGPRPLVRQNGQGCVPATNSSPSTMARPSTRVARMSQNCDQSATPPLGCTRAEAQPDRKPNGNNTMQNFPWIFPWRTVSSCPPMLACLESTLALPRCNASPEQGVSSAVAWEKPT
jgi:hypothetical protein